MIQIDGFMDSNVHFKWSNKLKPIAYVNSGDELLIKVPDSSTKQIKYDFKTEDLSKLDSSKFDGAVGPIYVYDAKPGDALEVEIQDIKVDKWGWSAILSDFGILKKRFNERLIIWDIKENYAIAKDFLRGIKIPIRPFLGVIGLSPKEDKEYDMIPPQYFGGNMDNRLNGIGSKIYLPVNVEGALLSISDPHASQGDGEICGTAIETSAEVKLKVKVIKDLKIKRPFTISPNKDDFKGEVIAAMGISSDLYQAAKDAVNDMIELLNRQYKLSYEEGYVLSSVIGNLRISEIVDEPNFVVSLVIPKYILES
ncbi:putative acetamidase/formamidase [Caldisphaera lagunensis DSM 15908]|uniref:Putative acetamidase/formamidase n=1 Tax=Caldisphaera lagunensis (strain DSM 15908 / JCM 11604 / ANMR 0165 / IC-154) TaxID=1056495 RepID=L0A9Z0_CALLD|nr:acetamidase/formamidase family protein [Caldisphaera lagunensis]AFZ69952.1 putative acetamidase/formamidase [Caldisphaera lagunensis DSM 15908]